MLQNDIDQFSEDYRVDGRTIVYGETIGRSLLDQIDRSIEAIVSIGEQKLTPEDKHSDSAQESYETECLTNIPAHPQEHNLVDDSFVSKDRTASAENPDEEVEKDYPVEKLINDIDRSRDGVACLSLNDSCSSETLQGSKAKPFVRHGLLKTRFTYQTRSKTLRDNERSESCLDILKKEKHA